MKSHWKNAFLCVLAVVAASSLVVSLTAWLSEEGLMTIRQRFERDSHTSEEVADEAESAILRRKRAGGIIRLRSPLRSSEIGIPVGMALDPPLCPPPPVTRSLGICYLQKCTTHKDCSRNGACCFNGCIHTCTKPMDRPAAFDWVEDTSKVLPILEVDSEDTPNLFLPILMENETSKYAAAEGGAELVHLPGGCYVTATRYLKLKEFMEAPSISQCRCSDGEVVCDVRMNRT